MIIKGLKTDNVMVTTLCVMTPSLYNISIQCIILATKIN